MGAESSSARRTVLEILGACAVPEGLAETSFTLSG
jgi:hypothetical protein